MPRIVGARFGADAREAMRGPGLMQCFGGADQRLRRHAADIDAGAADGAMTDERDLRALFRRGDRGRESSRARADNSKIEALAPVLRSATLIHDFCLVGERLDRSTLAR